MMTPRMPGRVPFTAGILICLCLAAGPVLSAGTITDLHVGPDGRHVIVKVDGLAGDHNAFTLRSPSRLVVDFDETAIGSVPARRVVKRGPIREVRIGYADGRARLVIDFGARSGLPYKVHKEANRVLIAFAKPRESEARAAASRKPSARATPAVHAKREVKPKRPARAAVNRNGARGALLLKSAGMEGDRIVLELARSDGRGGPAKLTVRVDLEKFEIEKAVLVDRQGRRAALAPSRKHDNDVEFTDSDEAKPEKKAARSGPVRSQEQKKYRWGMPAVRTRGPVKEPPAARRPPLRLERVTLEKRDPAGEG